MTVALNMVATIMNQNFSTVQTNNSSSNDFDAVLHDTITSKKSSENVSDNNADLKELKPVNEEEKIITISQSNNEKVKVDTSEKVELKTLDIETIEKEVLKQIADILKISEEELKNIMAESNLTFMDLFANVGLQTLIGNVFEINNEIELITHPEVYDAYKEINQALDNILEDMDLTYETLVQAVDTLDMQLENTKDSTREDSISVNVSTDPQITTEPKALEVEVVDMRNDTVNSKKEQTFDTSSQNDNHFDNIFSGVVTQKVEHISFNGVEELIYQQVSAKEIINQIATQMKVTFTEDVTSIAFQLQPENLGKVAFSVTHENGLITANFAAENNAVKEAIEMNLTHLKANLDEQGIKVDEIKVVVGNTAEFFNQDQQSNQYNQQEKNKSKKISRIAHLSLDEALEEDIGDITNQLNEYEHSVDYIA